MRTQSEILAELNRDLPAGIDWNAGARRYVQHYMKELGADVVEHYAMTKPLVQIPKDHNFERVLEENVSYLQNFVNVVELLGLPGGSRIMDVACGGWLSHFMTRMGYATFGFDLSEEYIALARRRILFDGRAWVPEHLIDGMFVVHDIETQPLPAEHAGAYDAIIFESCLHHFFDPIAALKHLVPCLKPGGVMVVIEAENREGRFRSEHLQVMLETETLERAYPRKLLEEIYEASGLPAYEFFGSVNGWVSPNDPRSRTLEALAEERARLRNFSVCAPSAETLARRFPWRVNRDDAPILPFGGLSEPTDGWYWSKPCSQMKVMKDLDRLKLAVLSEVPRHTGRSQSVFVHGGAGLLACATLTPSAQSQELELQNLGAGEILTFASADFFVPAQYNIQNDKRQLAFALKILEA